MLLPCTLINYSLAWGDYVRFYVLFVYLDIMGCIMFLPPSTGTIENKYDIPLTNAG
jgi:hypothetical protein